MRTARGLASSGVRWNDEFGFESGNDTAHAIAHGRALGMTAQTENSAQRHDAAIKLEFARMRSTYEQTMMSWIRTSTSLIAFGFSIYKFFQIEAPASPTKDHLIGPREFAFILVVIGTGSLLMATFEYRRNIKMLGEYYRESTRSLSVLLAGLISVLGTLALIAMILRE